MNDKSVQVNLVFTNWDIDDIILKIADYIRDGYHIVSYSVQQHGYRECNVEVEMIETH